MNGLSVNVEQSRTLTRTITDLLVQAEATVVLLTDIGGNILAQAPPREAPELLTIAALAAGAYSATRELARLTGESAFRSVSHEGQDTSLQVQGLDDEFLLVVVYQRTTTLGLVKLYARQAAATLTPLLGEIRRQTAAHVPERPFTFDETRAIFDMATPGHRPGHATAQRAP